MTTDHCPRVLILCQNKVQPFTGGGIVLSNLFNSFPADRLLFFHRDLDYGVPSPYREYRVTGRWLRPRPWALFSAVASWIHDAIRDFRSAHLNDLKLLLVQNSRVRIPSAIRSALDVFRPQLIYAWTGDSLWLEVLKASLGQCQVPYVIHFMDNHAGQQPESPVERVLYPAFLVHLNKAVASAAAIYTISRSMGEAYQSRFGKRYEVFHGLIETSAWPRPKPRRTGRPFTLVFTGSIERGQILGLIDIAKALDILVVKGFEACLILYLTEQYEKVWAAELAKHTCIQVRRHPDFSDLAETLASADLLMLSYGFDERTVNYYRYSFATKIVPYMLSGTCILAYGPADIEPIDYARRGGWASVVTKQDIETLSDQILFLINNDEIRARLALAAYEAALDEHELEPNARRFRDSLWALTA